MSTWRNRIVGREDVDPTQLLANPQNWRIHTKFQESALTGALDEIGWLRPVLVNRVTGHVVDGHLRIEAAISKDEPTVPVDYVDLTEDEERLALALLDSITGLAGRDDEKVRDLIASQAAPTNDAIAKMFSANLDLNAMIRLGKDHAPAGSGDVDALPPERETTIKPGDIIALGPHRLMCGDATKREDVNELVADAEKADMMFTDPPYGVNYGSSNKKNAIRGDITQAEIPISFNVSLTVLDDNARIYVCGGQTNVQMYWKLWDHHLHAQPHLIVWVKDSFVMRSNNYHSQFELVYYGWKGIGGGSDFWFGDRTDSDVWHVARDSERFHPTQKPVALCEKAIRNSCPDGGLIYEPFAGSGATLIAAERLKRRCYAMEIDRVLCQRIVDRWEGLTGEKAHLLRGRDEQ